MIFSMKHIINVLFGEVMPEIHKQNAIKRTFTIVKEPEPVYVNRSQASSIKSQKKSNISN